MNIALDLDCLPAPSSTPTKNSRRETEDQSNRENKREEATQSNLSSSLLLPSSGPLRPSSAGPTNSARLRYTSPAAFLEAYATNLLRALRSPDSPVDRILILTRPENHARFAPHRDERTEIRLLHRPLFEGHPVDHWPALIDRYPRVGAELLADHLHQKLRLMTQAGAHVLHFPADAHELMEIDAPIVLTLHTPTAALSATLADAIVVHSPDLYHQIDLPRPKIFCAPWPLLPSRNSADSPTPPPHAPRSSDPAQLTDNLINPGAAFAERVGDAYDHALASYELRKAA